MVEVGTHAAFAWHAGPLSESEAERAERLLGHLSSGMLVLAVLCHERREIETAYDEVKTKSSGPVPPCAARRPISSEWRPMAHTRPPRRTPPDPRDRQQGRRGS